MSKIVIGKSIMNMKNMKKQFSSIYKKRPRLAWGITAFMVLSAGCYWLNPLGVLLKTLLVVETELKPADVIVLGGCAAIEKAAKNAGHNVQVPFNPGRMDASAEQTDAESFDPLEPRVDGFRNYSQGKHLLTTPEMLIDRANLLTLSAPEMTALVGGMRVLNSNTGGAQHGVFTDRPKTLSNDFFVNLLDMNIEWKLSAIEGDVFEGFDRTSGEKKWTGTAVDLIFGSNSQLRAIAEVYGCDDAGEKFVHDVVAAWAKVMNLDRFDLDPRYQ